MIIDCISDLHGHYPYLKGGDLLIVAGDLTANDHEIERREFEECLGNQKYKRCIFIAGNHDNLWQFDSSFGYDMDDYQTPISYLCDSGTEFEGLKIWGSPWTKTFEGMNPKCKAFTVDTEEELAEKWALIPDDVDILITHIPPWGILDYTIDGRNVGSTSLHKEGSQRIRPKLNIFGHIHEAYGQVEMKNEFEGITYKFVNGSHVNERYQPVNKPIRVIL